MKKSPGPKKTKQKPLLTKDYVKVTKSLPLKIRIQSLDWLKAATILLMIFTHVTAIFFSFKSNSLIQYISLAGGTFCFTWFLLLSGSGNFLATKGFTSVKKSKLIKKSLIILVAFYLTAGLSLWVFGLGFYGTPSLEWIRDLVRIFFFQRIPPYTEYLIPFVFLTLSVALFSGFYRKVSKSIFLTALLSIIFYFWGYITYNIDLGDLRSNTFKSIFAGYSDTHTFPMLQYFMVFLIGIFVGKLLYGMYANKAHSKFKLGVLTMAVAVFAALGSVIFQLNQQIDFLNFSVYTGRFPPSLVFITIGIAAAYLMLIVLDRIVKTPVLQNKIIRSVIEFISKNSMLFFFWHIVIILFAKAFLAGYAIYYFNRSISIIAFWLITVVATGIAVKFTNILNKRFLSNNSSQKALSLITLGLLSFSLIAYAYNQNRDYTSQLQIRAESSFERVLDTTGKSWWNDEYLGRAEIIIPIGMVQSSGQTIAFSINHAEYISKGYSLFQDGKDIRVISFNQEYKEIPTVIENPGSDKITVKFKLAESRGTRYFFYFGNQYPSEKQVVEDLQSYASTFDVELAQPEFKEISLNLLKKWHLKGFNDNRDSTLSFALVSEKSSLSKVRFAITDEAGKELKSGLVDEFQTSTPFNYSVPLADLPVGTYFIETIDIEVKNGIQIYESKKNRFFVSYPIFVNWSLDWEGFGVNQVDLIDIADIVNKYGAKITHYFNPRIYVENQFSPFPVPPDHATYYTNWILQRRAEFGEEIGLHIHLYPDLLAQVEVEKVPGSEIVGIGRDETKLQAYSYEDLMKVFEWSIEKFKERGIGQPVSFRSGAWMSGPNVLKALQDSGISVDSSGRTSGLLNPSVGSSTPIPWNLAITTKPYKPNINDINSSLPPTLNLWEFPNNGADSYWFDANELVKRFLANYKPIMDSPQVVTYLSHPHQFKTFDSNKIRGLFDQTGMHDYAKDSGPLVYSTLESIYFNFDMTLF